MNLGNPVPLSTIAVLALTLSLACCSAEEPGSEPAVTGAGLQVLKPIPEEIREGIVLPVAETGVEEYPDRPIIEVVPTENGDVWINGARTGKAEVLETLGALDLPRKKQYLKAVTLQPVLLTAHGELPWEVVDRCISGCVHARISRVYLAVRRSADTRVTALLPTVYPWLEEERAQISLMQYAAVGTSLFLSMNGAEPVVAFTTPAGEPLPRRPQKAMALNSSELMARLKHQSKLPQRIATMRNLEGEEVPYRLVHIGAQPSVPYRHVVALADACRRAGFDRIAFLRPDLFRRDASHPLSRIGGLPVPVGVAAPVEVRREMELPISNQRNGPAVTADHMEVVITREGSLYFQCRKRSRGHLEFCMHELARGGRDTERGSGSSTGSVLITADGRALWREVMWVLQCCASPRVRVHRIYLSTETPGGEERQIAMFLPEARGLASGGPEDASRVHIQGYPRDDGGGILLKRGETEYGRGSEGLAEMSRRLKALREKDPDLRVVLMCHGGLPLMEVVKLLDAIKSTGVEDLEFAR